MDNYRLLLNAPCKKNIIIFLITFLLILLIILSCLIDSFDTYTTYGVYKEGHLFINVPLDNSDEVTKGSIIKINDTQYKYRIVEISDLMVQNNINYQTYMLYVNKLKLDDNKVENVTFYTTKEKIIKKVIKLIF